ncbi:ethanolamine kinase 1 isoform X2 [Rhinichthys klamathensis goyatoka]|uniref:ethanolamine kinase 1 isoform X2 n=1 Tax=Rhinichthys klamathensis goyatoka TaxID=3034132 RepID=UPI0024B53687|nr:ethanolamine kinase 1 isoform X2 [Rhinichthys klamathensis goyatoka]
MAKYIHVPEGAPAVPKLDVTVDEHDYRAGALKLIKTLRPHWKPSEVKLKFFTDGITNKLIGCYVGGSMQEVVLVRVYGNKTELFVDRENEVKSFRVLQAHRCAPRLYCTFNNGLCYEFLEGVALEPEHIRSSAVFRSIARQMAKYHAIHAHNGWVPQSDLWLRMSKYFSLVPTHFEDPEMDQRLNSEVPSSACLRDEMIWLQQNLSKLGSPVVLCHNDLLCKNIIYNQKEDVSLPKSLHLLHRAIATDWRCSVCPARTPPGPVTTSRVSFCRPTLLSNVNQTFLHTISSRALAICKAIKAINTH